VFAHKVEILEQDSSFVDTQTGNESLDFVFLDTCMTYEQEVQDLKDWYPKVKKGGLFSGHDWNCSAVQRAVNEFIETNKLTQQLSVFDNVWMLIK
jgi:predicted O-methyltransferase YrrM